MTFFCPESSEDDANWTQQWNLGPRWSNRDTVASARVVSWQRPRQNMSVSSRGAHLWNVNGDFDVRCGVCGVRHDLVDGDPRPGFIQVSNLTWGPNVLDGKFNESIIQSYAVFQVDPDRSQTCNAGTLQHAADLNHVDLQYALLVAPKREAQATASDGMSASCSCQDDVYSLQVSWRLPQGLSAVRLMISPVTTAGDVLPLGLTTGVIEDFVVTTGPPGRASTTVEGSLSMQVSNAAAFVTDPQVKLAVADGIATQFGVPRAWVEVDLQLVDRRLGVGTRRLQGDGTVQVNYIISVPATADAQGAQSVSSIVSSIEDTQPAAITATMTNAISSRLGTDSFSVAVTNISPPTVHTIATTPAPSPAASQGRGGIHVGPIEAEDDTDNTGVVVGAVVGTLLVLCCCFVVAAVVGNFIYNRSTAKVYEINELRDAAAQQDLPPGPLQWEDPIHRLGTQ